MVFTLVGLGAAALWRVARRPRAASAAIRAGADARPCRRSGRRRDRSPSWSPGTCVTCRPPSIRTAASRPREAAGARAILAATGRPARPITLRSLPDFKSTEACAYPLVRARRDGRRATPPAASRPAARTERSARSATPRSRPRSVPLRRPVRGADRRRLRRPGRGTIAPAARCRSTVGRSLTGDRSRCSSSRGPDGSRLRRSSRYPAGCAPTGRARNRERRRPRRRRSLSPRPGPWRAVRVVPWMCASSGPRLPARQRVTGRTVLTAVASPDAGRPTGLPLTPTVVRRRRGGARSVRSDVAGARDRLEGAAVAAHPHGEVVLHDLADLRLAQELVGAERVLDARGRVRRRRPRRGRGTAACRRRRAAHAGRGRAWWRCRATACGRRGSAGRSSSDRRPTAGRAAAATSSWP